MHNVNRKVLCYICSLICDVLYLYCLKWTGSSADKSSIEQE